jgi:PAS domain S-box-containing protein
MLDTIEQAAIATDLDGVIFFWNQCAERLYGWSKEEAIGRPIRDLLYQEDMADVVERIWPELREGRSWVGEFTLQRRDETPLQIWINDSPIIDEKGTVVGIIGISYDITERKQAEKALRESESRLRLAQQAARVGTWEWDVATGVAVWTDMVWHLLGLEPGEGAPTHERFIEFVHPEDRERARRKIREALAQGEDYENEFRIVRGDGEVLWLSSKGRVISSADGRPERMLGVNIDITERKRAEQSLEQLTGRLLQLQDEERRRIARELHDTTAQNLLAIVLNLETLVRMASTLPKDFSDAVLECQSLCEQSQAEIRTLSYLLHPPMLDEAGLPLALEWFIDGFSRRSGIHVDFAAPPDFRRLPTRMETALFRVVQESLTNIYRHSGGTTAEISLERAGGEVCLRVTDRGCGMAAASGDEGGAPDRRAETVGVGISGMRERLRQMGGHLEVRSDGAGTTVAAVLPLGKGEGG